MGHAPPPDLLTLADRFDRLAAGLGATKSNADLFTELAAAWAEPHRAYHTTAHLEDCLHQLDTVAAGEDRDRVEAALWFHDAVYDPRAGDNEARSAAWAREALGAIGVGRDAVEEVARLVLATRHADPPSDAGAALVTDVDLSILGRDPATYDEFERRIRLEYDWVPEQTFRRERSRILVGFLRRRPLYQTRRFRARYEDTARENLARTVARLERA